MIEPFTIGVRNSNLRIHLRLARYERDKSGNQRIAVEKTIISSNSVDAPCSDIASKGTACPLFEAVYRTEQLNRTFAQAA